MNSPSKSAQKNSGITCSYAFSLYLLQPVSTSILPSVFGEHSQFHNELEGEYLNRSRACSPHRGKQTCMHEQNVHTVHVCYMCKSNRCAQSGFNRRETFKSISVSVSVCGREKLGCRGNNFALVLTLFQWGSKYFCATINYLSVSDSLFLSLLLSCSHTHTSMEKSSAVKFSLNAVYFANTHFTLPLKYGWVFFLKNGYAWEEREEKPKTVRGRLKNVEVVYLSKC